MPTKIFGTLYMTSMIIYWWNWHFHYYQWHTTSFLNEIMNGQDLLPIVSVPVQKALLQLAKSEVQIPSQKTLHLKWMRIMGEIISCKGRRKIIFSQTFRSWELQILSGCLKLYTPELSVICPISPFGHSSPQVMCFCTSSRQLALMNGLIQAVIGHLDHPLIFFF